MIKASETEKKAAQIIIDALREAGYRVVIGPEGRPVVVDVPKKLTDFLMYLGERLVLELEKPE